MSIAIKSGAKVLYQWERGVALTASTPCDILRISREDDRVTDDLYPVISGSTGTALIPDRMLTESGYLHVSRIDYADGSERVLETVRILVRHAAKPQNTASSTKEVGDMQALRMQMAALERAAREGKFDGKDGITPHIGENGNWFAGDVDLGVRAKGDKGDKGDPGDTPHIGENGNWFVGDLDTGVRAKSADVSLYADDLYTSGVLVTDDLESFVMTGKTSDTGTPQLITSPGVVYIKGIRRRFAKSTRTFHVPGKECVSVQYIRLNEITGEIEQQNWEDVIIDGDIHNGGTITGIETGILPRRSGGYYDVILCIVTLPAGATEVTPDMITDLRGDERYCGFVRSKVDGGAKALTEHNVSENAHNDIRLLLTGLSERLNAIADSDDTTLDQLSEIVAYIKANKTLIESVTTSKVNVADIVDNLTTNVSDQPLSAKMGVELSRLISTVENSANNAMSQASSAMNHASSAEEIASSAQSMASSAMNHASSAEEIASSAMQRASSAEQMASAAQTEIEKLKENGIPSGGALTAENIETALGYTPANAETVDELSEAISKLEQGSGASTAAEQVDDTILVDNAYDASTAKFNYRLYSSGTETILNGCVLLDYAPVKYDPDVYVLISGIESLGVRWDTRFTVNYFDADKNALALGQKAPSEFSPYLKNDFDGTLPCSFRLFRPANTVEGIENTEFVRIRLAITSDDTTISASNCEGLVVKIATKGTYSADAKGIPSHWEKAVEEKTQTVQALQEQGGKNCVSFAWASDTHIPDNDCGRTDYIGRVMANMLDNCDIPFAVISGDAGTRGALATEAEYLECYEQMTEHLAPLWGTDRLLVSIGNHDGCWGRDETASPKYYRRQFSPERMWSTYFRGQALDFRKVFSDNGLYYYVDNIPQKTRFIVLNSQFEGEYSTDTNGFAVNNRFATSCYGQEQLDWLADVALDMPSGYSAVIITHVPPRAVNGGTIPYTVDCAQFIGIINAYINKTTYSGSFSGVAGWTSNNVSVNFADAQGEIIALFAGHVHEDTIDTETLDCPIITVAAGGASANEGNPNYNRPFGTSLETSFDVVTINRATKMIYCTRVGAGNDRAVSYVKAEIATYTVTWVVNGNTTIETYNEGEIPSFKGSTDKASDGQYNYTFAGWSPAITAVTGDITYTAQYSKTEIVPDVVTYTVTNALTNCSNSNSVTTVEEGSVYSGTITANDGYTLDSVVVTMGGSDVTVTDGVISISFVTGNIVITASASETFANLAEPNDDNTTDWSIWINNARMGSDSTYRSNAGTMITNYIEMKPGETVYLQGTEHPANGDLASGNNIAFFKTTGNSPEVQNGNKSINGLCAIASSIYSYTADDDGMVSSITFIKPNGGESALYLRLVLPSSIDKSKVIISKRPIT